MDLQLEIQQSMQTAQPARGVESEAVDDRERTIVSQTNIGTVSKATLGKLLRDGVERIWAFPSEEIPS